MDDSVKRPEASFAEKIVFDANLQEFGHRVGIVCGLESAGKLSAEDAYQRIRDLWKQLKRSKKGLHIDKPPS